MEQKAPFSDQEVENGGIRILETIFELMETDFFHILDFSGRMNLLSTCTSVFSRAYPKIISDMSCEKVQNITTRMQTPLDLLCKHSSSILHSLIHEPIFLFVAAVSGHLPFTEMVARRVQGAKMNVKDPLGNTPLHWAAGLWHAEVVEILLAHGADHNARNNSQNTPLHSTVSHTHKTLRDLQVILFNTMFSYTKIVETLVAKGADVNARNSQGATPLHLACYHQKVTPLLKCKADVNAANICGDTPLHYCAMYYSSSITVRELIWGGADLAATNVGKDTPLHCAVRCGKRYMAEVLAVEGSNVEAQNMHAETPLSLAEQHWNADLKTLAKAWRDRALLKIAVERSVNTIASNMSFLCFDSNLTSIPGLQ